MQMHFIIAILFAITLFLAFVEERLSDRQKTLIMAGYAIVMIFLATTKSIEHTADALTYEEMFLNNDDLLLELATEPTFIHLSRLVLSLGGTVAVMFFIYAVIAIPQKLFAISKLTPYFFTAMLIYLPVYFELHDLIQVRVSAAAAFLMASIIPLANRRYVIAALLIVCGILFHYSAVAYLPFLLIGNRKLNLLGRIVVGGLLPVAFAMYLMKKDLFSLIPAPLTEGKLDFYKDSTELGDWEEIDTPYKNMYFLSKCLLLYICLFFYDYIVEKNRYAPLLINMFAAGMIFLLTMATIPVIAGRVSDLYGIVDCLVFSLCLYLVDPQWLARVAVALVGLFMLFYNMLFTEYFT